MYFYVLVDRIPEPAPTHFLYLPWYTLMNGPVNEQYTKHTQRAKCRAPVEWIRFRNFDGLRVKNYTGTRNPLNGPGGPLRIIVGKVRLQRFLWKLFGAFWTLSWLVFQFISGLALSLAFHHWLWKTWLTSWKLLWCLGILFLYWACSIPVTNYNEPGKKKYNFVYRNIIFT